MSKKPSEWFKQADYDMDTADYMFEGKRYVYAVFMCHLSIEKTLKGLYQEILEEVPPNTHSLLFLLEKIELDLPQELYDFVFMLNRVSIPTRYPDDLAKIMKDFDRKKTKEILTKGKEVLKWLKVRSEKQ
ncbi:MAG: HEPN domain-containing protein [Deltaproteobacteria bacterium]|nr:HEPN domain-containing protein [Deltaproteobacteria bacterium]